MLILATSGWDDYSLLDSGGGHRLEQFGKYVLSRPDPQAIWQPRWPREVWRKADAVFTKDQKGREGWQKNSQIPDRWMMRYNDLSFYAALTLFKHTGIFPEQIIQWEWMKEQVVNSKFKITNNKNSESDREINILNLFGYTGIASLILAKAGVKVTHVDASRPSISWARQNQEASGLSGKPIRWILDDAVKFTAREIRRGEIYDAILMDPPVYGHGPEGQPWDFYKNFPVLLQNCEKLLSPNPLFVLVNAYAISASAIMLENLLSDTLSPYGGEIESGELALKEKKSDRLFSTGIFARWSP